jgi:uncharacterized protein
MSTLAPAVASPDASAAEPVRPERRILTLDVLRGIALLGVVLANVEIWFSGYYFRAAELRPAMGRLNLDAVAHHLTAVLVTGKAISIFSFLFGVGLAMQARRAEARGAEIGPLYRRRMAVLLCLGVMHGVLLWYGDILTAYALLGFALLLFRRRSDRALLAWSAALLVVVPLLLGGLMWWAVAAAGPNAAGSSAGARAAALEAFRGMDPARIVAVNVKMLAQGYLGFAAIQLFPHVLGLFVLGLWAGRHRLLESVGAHRAAYRRVMGWGFALGLPASVAMAAARTAWTAATGRAHPWLYLAVAAMQVVSVAPLAAAYLSGLVLLLETPAWKRRLAVFAPVGRMALTNYLAQTVLCIAVFYGGGLVGRVGPAAAVGIALLVYAAQLAWSPWWLARFRFGPAEWVWRSLTYGRRQPMRIHAPAVRPVLAG